MRDRLPATPGIFLAGNYLTGVGVEHAAQSGYNVAEEVMTYLQGADGANSEAGS